MDQTRQFMKQLHNHKNFKVFINNKYCVFMNAFNRKILIVILLYNN